MTPPTGRPAGSWVDLTACMRVVMHLHRYAGIDWTGHDDACMYVTQEGHRETGGDVHHIINHACMHATSALATWSDRRSILHEKRRMQNYCRLCRGIREIHGRKGTTTSWPASSLATSRSLEHFSFANFHASNRHMTRYGPLDIGQGYSLVARHQWAGRIYSGWHFQSVLASRSPWLAA